MNIAIIGAGSVGSTLGFAFSKAGHTVTYAVRDPLDAKHSKLLAHASLAKLRDAVSKCELAVLATPWNAAEEALREAGDFATKVLVDATNPIGPGFSLTHGHTDSGAEQVARWAPSARVVKAFNTTGFENMANPTYRAASVAMFICGDDQAASTTVEGLAREIGFDPMLAGPLSKARLLEPVAMLWIQLAVVFGQGRNFAFGILRRPS
jgi:8-hydroxy-5-deazaflavin:NADPH oxidoreductase